MNREELEARSKELHAQITKVTEQQLMLRGALAECMRLISLLDAPEEQVMESPAKRPHILP